MLEGNVGYSSMRNSEVPWVGRLPKHWDVKRGKALFLESRLPVRDEDEIVTCFRDGQVTLRRNRRTRGFMIALKEAGYQGVRRGQLVVHSMDAFAGAVGISDSNGKCSPEYIVCNLRYPGWSAEYFAHALRVAARAKFIEVSCPAVRERAPRLRYPNLGGMLLPVPPPDEQAAIVRFLDHLDRRIRRGIGAKQKLIKLLGEQKRAIVDRAVTRGIAAGTRFRASGVNWLGDVPEHWATTRLKWLVSSVTSGSRGWSNYAADSGVLFIRIGNLTRTSIDLDMDDVVRLQLPNRVLGEAARTRIQENDILLSITAFIGSVAVVPRDVEEAYVSQHVACCRPRVGAANPRWIAYVLLSTVGQTHGQLSMYGGTKQGLSLDDVKNHIVLLPPREDQDRLVRWIEGASAAVDKGIKKAKREMAFLSEYRSALVGAVVTGKIDVRDVAAMLPDEVGMSEPPEEIGEVESAEVEAEGGMEAPGEVDQE